MEPKNQKYVEHKMDADDRLPVYDAEIVDEREEEAKVMPVKANLPEKKIAYRLGKAAGTISAGIGFLNEFRRMFGRGYTGGGGSGRGIGMGKRRRKGKKGDSHESTIRS